MEIIKISVIAKIRDIPILASVNEFALPIKDDAAAFRLKFFT